LHFTGLEHHPSDLSKDAMIDHTPGSPLSGRYLIRNPVANRLLGLVDWILARRLSRGRALGVVPEPRRILLANGAHLGDVLLSLGVLAPLRSAYPRARIGFLIGSWARPLLRDHPLVDWVHVVDHWKLNRAPLPLWHKLAHHHRTRRMALREIRDNHYDVAIDLYSYFPNTIPLLWQAGIPVRIGYTSGGFGPLLTHRLAWTHQQRHITDYQADLLRLLGLTDKHLACQHVILSPGDSQLPRRVREELRRHALPPDDFIIFHMGTGALLKEWPEGNWRQLATRAVNAGRTLVFTGSTAQERSNCDQVVAGLGRCLNLCGRLSWQEFVATVRAARVLVGVDSVAGHVAAAVGTPCVVVYSGITDPAQWGPRGTASKVLSHHVPCAPCYLSRGCAGMECVRLVSVDEVHAAITELLRKSHRTSA
jgi:ADP-heptose:LPS heptosyltransferase